MIAPCPLYSQFTTLSVNFKLTILSKSPHLSLNLSLKLETHHILTLSLTTSLTNTIFSGEHNYTILFSQNNILKSKNSETAL